ncbi:cation-translocating P-type ATPase [Solirhodobacter olei]|uniref:cation-translocating P-type ATPase n=1 Tax=Solirhodobacter olei TaxID=2493082 RepID=UPI001F4D8211|nr:cation-transporting P-type ATPase [Solirhodobacter olei]
MIREVTDTCPPYAREARDVLDLQGVDATRGLSEDEAEIRRARFGPNNVAARERVGLLALILNQFKSPVVALLAGAALIAGWFGELEEALAIGVVLGLNTAIGFFTELRAVRSIEALRRLEAQTARVRRDGHERVIPAERLVPGDILLLEAGDAVPADLRIVEASNLNVDESTLTGESVPVGKGVPPVPAAARLGDRRSMLFKGTAVIRGSALGVVTGIGMATELGQVSRLVTEAGSGSSPIERKLAHLSAQLVWATLLIAAAIVGFGVLTGKDALLMVEAGIALSVAAIPEGLPIVATLTLARGMWRMAEQNALVERLSAVETLGATTIILTDKTGTLTENRMTVRRVWLPSGEVTMGDEGAAGLPVRDAQMAALMEVAVLCNAAALDRPDDPGAGDPMEVALLRAGLEAGLSRADLLARAPRVREHPFDSVSKRMTTVHRVGSAYRFAVKGAPEAVLPACETVSPDGALRPMTAHDRRDWAERVAELAHHGLRVLACAEKTSAEPDAELDAGLTFLGLIGLEDPARLDVPEAIEACHRAGIRVVMVTGDHAVTARSIGRAVGLGHRPEDVALGGELAGLASNGYLDRIGIFARVSPREKLDLVRAYQVAGEIVAMTGDGVNDAPALRQADIGVAMGLRGTDVAREAAAMVLLDDAFPTIVAAIREGRVIFGNIRRFAAYLLACNLAEVMVVSLAVAPSLPLPLLPLQILYLNLITDVFPAFALALCEGEGDALSRPPRPPRQPILGRPQWRRILAQSLLMAGGTFGALLAAGATGQGAEATVTITFLTLAFAQLWHVFNMRSDRAHPLVNEITRNRWIWAALMLCSALLVVPPYLPPLADVLGLVPPGPGMWALALGFSLLPTALWQAAALLRRKGRG